MDYANKAGSGAVGGQIRQAEQAKKVPQVEQELAGLDSDIGRLGAYIEQLEAQLRMVLRSNPPTTAGPGAEVAEVLVGTAESIRNQRYRVAQITDAIESMMNRLEV